VVADKGAEREVGGGKMRGADVRDLLGADGPVGHGPEIGAAHGALVPAHAEVVQDGLNLAIEGEPAGPAVVAANARRTDHTRHADERGIGEEKHRVVGQPAARVVVNIIVGDDRQLFPSHPSLDSGAASVTFPRQPTIMQPVRAGLWRGTKDKHNTHEISSNGSSGLGRGGIHRHSSR